MDCTSASPKCHVAMQKSPARRHFLAVFPRWEKADPCPVESPPACLTRPPLGVGTGGDRRSSRFDTDGWTSIGKAYDRQVIAASGIPYVATDNKKLVQLAYGNLIEHGLERFASSASGTESWRLRRLPGPLV